jgi:hypothetical protein
VGYYGCADGTEYSGEWSAGRMQGKGTLWFPNRTFIVGKVSGHLADNNLTVEGQLQRDADPRGLSRKRSARWEHWFSLKNKPPHLLASPSLSALEPFGALSSSTDSPSVLSSSPSSLRSSTSSLSTRGSTEEQLLALASLGASDAVSTVMQLLRTSESLSVALVDWVSIFRGVYSASGERVASLHSRVLEDVQSFLVGLGMQVLRVQPELNTEAGLDAVWLALELSVLPPIYDVIFNLLRKKVSGRSSALRYAHRFRRWIWTTVIYRAPSRASCLCP